jgi:hypothetical protein
VFDHVVAGRIAEQPAGKHALVLLLAPVADIDLNESAGFLRHFPRCGAFARGQRDDDRAKLARFTRFQADFFGHIVALVQQAKHCHPVGHRGCTGIAARCRCAGGRGRGGLSQGHFDRFGRRRSIAAGCQHQPASQRGGIQRGGERGPHDVPQLSALPGVHAS